jgi:glutamate synthase (NADPH/NADH) large chain
MTGGRVAILGKTGRNFAAGMSGGIAYIYDSDGAFKDNCNMNMVELMELGQEDLDILKNLLANHHKYTNSHLTRSILDNFNHDKKKFIKVMPLEYKRILESRSLEKKLQLTEVSDG